MASSVFHNLLTFMSVASDHASPLPLPCTGFEHYMFTDEWPSHPMVSYLEVELTGPLELEALSESLQDAYARHPLLAAVIERRRGRGICWVAADPPTLRLLERGPEDLPSVESEYLDLSAEPGSRVYLHWGPERSTLYFFVHHACADALGMFTFLADWLNAYGRLLGRDTNLPDLPPVNWNLLHDRESLRGVRSPLPLRERLAKFAKILRTSKPRPLALGEEIATERMLSPGHCEYRFTVDEFRQLKTFTQREGITLNDLLTAAMLQALAVWQRQHGDAQADDLLRLIVPVSRRTLQDRELSAVNKIGYKFISRTLRQVDQGVLRDVHKELEFVRQNRLGIINLLKAVTWMQRLRLTRVMLPKSRCFATAVFSNLGDVGRLLSDRLPLQDGRWTVAGLTVQRVQCAPPRRPLTHTTVVVIGYGNTVTLCSRGDGRGLGPAQTQSFLNLLGQEVRRLAELEMR